MERVFCFYNAIEEIYSIPMVKKFLAIILLVALVLTGCRTKVQEAPKSYRDVELTYYRMFDDSDVFDPMIQQYETDHPGLKIHYKKFSNFDDYQKVILNEMAEGQGPDIFSMPNSWFISNYRKISPMPEKYGTPNDFSATFAGVTGKDLIRPDADGIVRIYGLPMSVDTLALYYNKAYFEDKLPSKGKPSGTWEGIKENVSALVKMDNSSNFEIAGIALGRSDNISKAVDILYLLFLQNGLQFYNENISEAVFAENQGSSAGFPSVNALNLYTSFADKNNKSYSWNESVVASNEFGQEVSAFAAGKVAMIIGYSYTYDLILNSINKLNSNGVKPIDKGDIEIAPIPQLYDSNVSTEKRVTYSNYFAETVSRNSKNADLAWDFLTFLTTKKNLQLYFKATHRPTSRRDMIEDQKKDPIYGVFAGQIGYGASFPIVDMASYKNIFSAVISKINSGGGIIHDEFANAQNLINEILPKKGILTKPVSPDKQKVDDKTK